jgi:DNA-directed RNA polymerase subunit M/transcription elongation factor TFIIS
MEFCDDCHALVLLEVSSDSGKLQRRCSRCSRVRPVTEVGERELTVGKSARRRGGLARVQERTEALCERCNNTQAFFVQLQTRGADEPSTQFFTCTKCGHKYARSPAAVIYLTRAQNRWKIG